MATKLKGGWGEGGGKALVAAPLKKNFFAAYLNREAFYCVIAAWLLVTTWKTALMITKFLDH